MKKGERIYRFEEIKRLVGRKIIGAYIENSFGTACESLLLDDGTVVEFNNQDPYTYHDCDRNARDIVIYNYRSIHIDELKRRFGKKAVAGLK